MTPPHESPRDDQPLLICDDMLAPPTYERVDFEQRMSYLPLLTISLILINSAVFVWELTQGAIANDQAIIDAGALVRNRVMQGEVWRVASAMFLHGGPGHLIGNCIVLFIVGMACEHAFGLRRFVLIYVASGLCGSLLSMLMHPGPSVGASGAIFGVMGALVCFFYRHQRAVMLRDKRIGFVLLIWAGYQVISGFATPLIDNFAHIGGFLGGVVMALVLTPPLVQQARIDERSAA